MKHLDGNMNAVLESNASSGRQRRLLSNPGCRVDNSVEHSLADGICHDTEAFLPREECCGNRSRYSRACSNSLSAILSLQMTPSRGDENHLYRDANLPALRTTNIPRESRDETVALPVRRLVRLTSDNGITRPNAEAPFALLTPIGEVQQITCSKTGHSSAASHSYRGICLPETTQCGITRGNYAQLHRKAWLEVADSKHRYGKNLRVYYRHWESLGYPTQRFFDWLDACGEAEGQEKPDLPECSRSDLDADTVLYIDDKSVTRRYALQIQCDSRGRATIFDAQGQHVRTGPEGWIFVVRDGVLYGSQKVVDCGAGGSHRQRFHHSSFFGGKAVSTAGILVTNSDGILKQVLPHSGHYRPGEPDLQRLLVFLQRQGVLLRGVNVDIQQLVHVNRLATDSAKLKKKDSQLLLPADVVGDYLSHKARCLGLGIFAQIRAHQCSTTNNTCEREFK